MLVAKYNRLVADRFSDMNQITLKLSFFVGAFVMFWRLQFSPIAWRDQTFATESVVDMLRNWLGKSLKVHHSGMAEIADVFSHICHTCLSFLSWTARIILACLVLATEGIQDWTGIIQHLIRSEVTRQKYIASPQVLIFVYICYILMRWLSKSSIL